MLRGVGMIMGRSVRAILVACLLLALGGSAAWAGHGGGDSPRPVKAVVAGTNAVQFAGPSLADTSTFEGRCSTPSNWLGHMEATGTMSHLGTVHYDAWHCVQFDVQTFTGTFNDSEVVLTAANGDSVTMVHEGAFVAGETIGITADAEITGGTGRFAGAEGTVTETFVETWDLDFSGTLDGVITYDASGRSHR